MRNFVIGKVLVVEADASKVQQRKSALLTAKATSVEVVTYDFQALVRLGKPNHDYSFVFLGDEVFTPNELQEMLLADDLFEETC